MRSAEEYKMTTRRLTLPQSDALPSVGPGVEEINQWSLIYTHIHILTSNVSNAAWKSLKSPAEVSSSASTTDAENVALASFRGSGKN